MSTIKTNILIIIASCIFCNQSSAQIGCSSNKQISLSRDLEVSQIAFSKHQTQKNSFGLAPKRMFFKKAATEIGYNPKRDPKRLLYNTGLYLGTTVISFTALWLMPESVTNWDKEQIKEEGVVIKWEANVNAGPVWDEDDWVLNYVMHPWFGGIYYMTARGSGFKAWESFAYSAVMSTVFWEYGIESFAEVPSTQDLFVTPIAGSIIGEGFFIAKKGIIKNDKRILGSRALGRFTIFLMDPFNAMLNGFGYKTKNKVSSTTAFVPVGFDPNSKKTVWGMQVAINF